MMLHIGEGDVGKLGGISHFRDFEPKKPALSALSSASPWLEKYKNSG